MPHCVIDVALMRCPLLICQWWGEGSDIYKQPPTSPSFGNGILLCDFHLNSPRIIVQLMPGVLLTAACPSSWLTRNPCRCARAYLRFSITLAMSWNVFMCVCSSSSRVLSTFNRQLTSNRITIEMSTDECEIVNFATPSLIYVGDHRRPLSPQFSNATSRQNGQK